MMKTLFKLTLLFGIGLVQFICISCKESTEDPAPVPPPVVTPPAVLNTKIFKSVYPTDNSSISIKDSVVVSFNEMGGKVKTIDNVKYRAMVDEVILMNVTVTTTWATDSLTVIIRPVDMMNGESTYQISIKLHWEVFSSTTNTWNVVEWEGNQLRENSLVNFKTLAADIKIESSNIEYLYPVPNQYHFLVDEYPFGFVKLKRGQESLFAISGYTYAAILTDLNGSATESAITYEKENRLIKFAIPSSLQPETIYALKLIARSASSAETVLIAHHFRTSKYKTFTEKFNTYTFGFSGDYLTSNIYDQPLFNWITGAGEFFDSFELSKESVDFNINGSVFSAGYLNGLVRLEAVLPGTNWYDQYIYPFMFAPWTESSFNPTPSRDISKISYPPIEAMYFSDCGSGELTTDMISMNSAPVITGGTRPEIIWRLSLIMYDDFGQIQSKVVAAYGNNANAADREKKVMSAVFQRLTTGKYNYEVKYTLPSGQVTSTIPGIINY